MSHHQSATVLETASSQEITKVESNAKKQDRANRIRRPYRKIEDERRIRLLAMVIFI